MKNNKVIHYSIIGIFVSLYFLVATISMINSVAFFDIAHSGLMNWALAIGFELGAAASLAAIIILDKTNKVMVWSLFILLTAFQMMSNSYHAFINLENYIGWIELFGLQEEEPILQKRILSIVSGAILPLIALGFIKSLTDYIRPNEDESAEEDDLIKDLGTTIFDDLEEHGKESEGFTVDNVINETETKHSDLHNKEIHNVSDKKEFVNKDDSSGKDINIGTVKSSSKRKLPPSPDRDFRSSDGASLNRPKRTGDYIT
jgi:hypothetical protein